MKKSFLKTIQTLLVFSLAFTLTSCWNFDNPLEEMSGSGSGGSGDGGGSSTVNATDIKLYQTMKVIKMGGSATITATPVPSDATITWESSDAAVATVSNGVVTPVAVGFATITAKSGDVKATCQIFVGNEVALASSNCTVQNYDILKGDLLSGKSITIPDGVNVAFDGITTDQTVTCEGDATIYLTDGSTNTVNVSTDSQAGIVVGGSGKTLIIDAETAGTGKLNVKGGDGGAGIGTNGYATYTCGDITIRGGTVNATGGYGAAGIGNGTTSYSVILTCGKITIGAGVTSVTACGGSSFGYVGAGSPIGIGGNDSNEPGGIQKCGTITFGSTQVFDGTSAPGTNTWDASINFAVNGDYGPFSGLTLTISGNTWTLTPTAP